MGAIGTTLTTEIQRVSRKAMKKDVDGLRKALSGLKKMAAELQKAIRTIGKARPAAAAKPVKEPAGEEAAEGKAARFTPKSVISLRKRLGVSQAELAKLAGVSTGSVFHWEKGKAKPRGAGVAGLMKLRAIGKNEARVVLDAAKSVVAAMAKPEPETADQPAAKPSKPRRARKAKTEAKPAAKPESAPKAKPKAQRKSKPKAAAEAQPKAEAKAGAKVKAKPSRKPRVKAEPKAKKRGKEEGKAEA